MLYQVTYIHKLISITFTSTIVEFFTSLSLFVKSISSEIPCTKNRSQIWFICDYQGPGSMGCSHLSVSISLKSFSTHTSSHSSIVLNLLLFPEEDLVIVLLLLHYNDLTKAASILELFTDPSLTVVTIVEVGTFAGTRYHW